MDVTALPFELYGRIPPLARRPGDGVRTREGLFGQPVRVDALDCGVAVSLR